MLRRRLLVEDDPLYVDMGNGVLWATRNLTKDVSGKYMLAENPWDYGAYFSWGDIEGHNVAGQNEGYEFSSENYWNGASGEGHNLTASFTSGDATYDAARAKLGGEWRMPTETEFEWLTKNCYKDKTYNYKGSGIAGRLFTSKINGNTLFFPAAGRYYCNEHRFAGSIGFVWSSDFYEEYASSAWCLYFDSGQCSVNYNSMTNGNSIRPVMGGG